ncbi:unnamed protein product [Schistosoma margrebowiei]|uniref:Uncharacterized protein n=1 Tax=Schistosoma margrebowiei TaxID=48269 RepID=A0A183M6P0_9TREM|nr:unnamed protein product [Schistosoma margrebowiei]
MEDTFKLRMRGNALSALLSIVRCIQNKPRYFAEKLFKAMQFVETADKALIRIIVSRCEIDMKNIMKEFYKITGNTLDECIDFNIWSLGNEPTNLFIDRTLWNETPSNYRRLLLKYTERLNNVGDRKDQSNSNGNDEIQLGSTGNQRNPLDPNWTTKARYGRDAAILRSRR